MLDEKDSLLFIVDIQDKLLNSVYNKQELEKKSAILVKTASLLNIPIIVTEQYPKGLGETITSLKNVMPENVKYFEKTSFSALENSDFKEYITALNKKQIILCGIETHICVSQTAQELIKNGYEVFLVSDASGSRAEKEHAAGILRMQYAGANIITTEIGIFELLRTSKHPKFKEIQVLIK